MGGKRPPPPSSWVTGLPISQRTLNALGLGPGPRRASYVNMHFATSGVWGDEAADIQVRRWLREALLGVPLGVDRYLSFSCAGGKTETERRERDSLL
jgi:hypothetical protein